MKISKLADVLSNNYSVQRRCTVAPTVVAPKYVNSKDLVPIGVTVPIEKPIPFIEPKPIVERPLVSRDQHLIVRAYLSLYPHYEFVSKIHSGYTNKIKFWFKDTKRSAVEGKNVIVVANYKDMLQELELSMHTSQRTKDIVAEEGPTAGQRRQRYE